MAEEILVAADEVTEKPENSCSLEYSGPISRVVLDNVPIIRIGDTKEEPPEKMLEESVLAFIKKHVRISKNKMLYGSIEASMVMAGRHVKPENDPKIKAFIKSKTMAVWAAGIDDIIKKRPKKQINPRPIKGKELKRNFRRWEKEDLESLRRKSINLKTEGAEKMAAKPGLGKMLGICQITVNNLKAKGITPENILMLTEKEFLEKGFSKRTENLVKERMKDKGFKFKDEKPEIAGLSGISELAGQALLGIGITSTADLEVMTREEFISKGLSGEITSEVMRSMKEKGFFFSTSGSSVEEGGTQPVGFDSTTASQPASENPCIESPMDKMFNMVRETLTEKYGTNIGGLKISFSTIEGGYITETVIRNKSNTVCE